MIAYRLARMRSCSVLSRSSEIASAQGAWRSLTCSASSFDFCPMNTFCSSLVDSARVSNHLPEHCRELHCFVVGEGDVLIGGLDVVLDAVGEEPAEGCHRVRVCAVSIGGVRTVRA